MLSQSFRQLLRDDYIAFRHIAVVRNQSEIFATLMHSTNRTILSYCANEEIHELDLSKGKYRGGFFVLRALLEVHRSEIQKYKHLMSKTDLEEVRRFSEVKIATNKADLSKILKVYGAYINSRKWNLVARWLRPYLELENQLVVGFGDSYYWGPESRKKMKKVLGKIFLEHFSSPSECSNQQH